MKLIDIKTYFKNQNNKKYGPLPMMKDLFPGSRLPHIKEVPDRIDQNYINLSGSSSWLSTNSGIEAERFVSPYCKTMREWLVGRVLKVHFEEGYFDVQLKDTRGVERLAKFDIDKVFEDHSDLDQHLFPGAKFVFSVGIQHDSELPTAQSREEFSAPFIWQEENNKA